MAISPASFTALLAAAWVIPTRCAHGLLTDELILSRDFVVSSDAQLTEQSSKCATTMEFQKYDEKPMSKTDDLLQNSPILVIDDEELVTELIDHQLRAAGFQNVVTLNDSMSVMDQLQREKPELILTDLQMPDVSGKYLLQVINKDPELANVPIVVISGDGDSKDDTLELGATFFLSKPVEPEALVECVFECLKRKRVLDELEYSASRERASLRRARMDSCKKAESQLRVQVRGT